VQCFQPEKETSARFAQKFIVQSSLLLLQLPLLLWLEDAPDGSINHSHLKMKIATTTSSATTTHAATNQQKQTFCFSASICRRSSLIWCSWLA
jgi:hypothetical protein